jgi:hypothetical protein
LELALERARQGHDVQLGAMFDHRLGKNVGGDVVDFTAKEVIQSKDLTTRNERTLWEEIALAARQVMGKLGEFPPVDSKGREFKKIIEIRLDEVESSDLARLTSRILSAKLEERMQLHGDLEGFDGLLRIRVGERVMEYLIRSGNPGTVQPKW